MTDWPVLPVLTPNQTSASVSFPARGLARSRRSISRSLPPPAAQQRDEQRRADERHDRAYRELTGTRDGSRHEIRGGEQHPARKRRGGRDDAVIGGAEGEAHRGRRDEPHETDRAGA